MPDPSVLTVPHELLILGAAVKTGIIETFANKPATCAGLAKELKADPRAVWVVVEALLALGYLDKNGEMLSLSDEARKMIYEPEAPNYTGFSFMHRYNLILSWAHLPEVIQSGKPHPRERTPADTAYFMAAMRHGAGQSTPAIAEFLLSGAPSGMRVLDIGGGPLAHARVFASHGARVTVLDRPEVVELMGEEAKAAGIEMVGGDFNVALPQGPFELAYLGNICHIFGEKENRELFNKVKRTLAPGGRIAIVDMIRGTNPFAAVFGVNMLVNTVSGGTWTLAQYTDWLEPAGFAGIRLNEKAGRQIVTAAKK
ncbi:MAG: class I SAM-dependent methyltransferase [Eubacteriales bacterium]